MNEFIAGIRVPDSAMARAAIQLVRDTEDDLLYNHSRRVFFWGALTGERNSLKYDPELLHMGAMFHDMGLTEALSSPDLRFEVDGANIARDFLKSYGVPSATSRMSGRQSRCTRRRVSPSTCDRQSRLLPQASRWMCWALPTKISRMSSAITSAPTIHARRTSRRTSSITSPMASSKSP